MRQPESWRITISQAVLLLPLSALALTPLHSFTNVPDGAAPYAELAQGNDGNFYGTTFGGGTNGFGAVFKMSASGKVTELHSFTYGPDGATPTAGLTLGSNGNFFGTTFVGGTNFSYGGLFEIGTNGALTPLYSFTNGVDGANPYAGLAEGSDGNLYGTTHEGGAGGAGTVFRATDAGGLTALYSFTNGIDGGSPYAGLTQASDGNFYGTAFAGGTNGLGTVFRISPGGTFTPLYSFMGGADGAQPVARLLQAADGCLYGTTYSGGAGSGVVFKMTTNGVCTPLYAFTNGVDGASPSGGLIQGSDGFLYGTTQFGGASGDGTIIKVSTGGVLTPLYLFTNGVDGANSSAALIQGSDGYLYGTTQNGGGSGAGVVFKTSPKPAPMIEAINRSGSTVLLTWSTVPGQTYQLQYTTNLNGGAWTNVGVSTGAGNGSASESDSIQSDTQRFYRVESY